MEKSPIKGNEEERLKKLNALNILDTPPEQRLDFLSKIAAKLLNVPISVISMIDSKRDWYKSSYGIDKKEGTREQSISGHALYAEDVFIVSDTQKDPRFFDNPLVIGEPYIRSYAGVPIYSNDGHQAIGVFCVEGKEPKTFLKEELDLLKELSRWAEEEFNKVSLEGKRASERKTSSGVFVLNALLEDLNVATPKFNPAAVFTIDLEQKVTSWDHTSENILGYTSNEIIGQPIKKLWANEKNDFPQIFEKISRGSKIENFQALWKKKDASSMNISVSTIPIQDKERVIVGLMIVALELVEVGMERFYKFILSNSTEAIISWNFQYEITSWNRAAENLFGYLAEEVLGQSIHILAVKENDNFEEILNTIKLGEAVEQHEEVRKKKEGSPIVVISSAFPLYDENNRIIGVGAFMRGITKDKEEASKVRNYVEELERFNRLMIDREIKMVELKKEIKRLTSGNK